MWLDVLGGFLHRATRGLTQEQEQWLSGPLAPDDVCWGGYTPRRSQEIRTTSLRSSKQRKLPKKPF